MPTWPPMAPNSTQSSKPTRLAPCTRTSRACEWRVWSHIPGLRHSACPTAWRCDRWSSRDPALRSASSYWTATRIHWWPRHFSKPPPMQGARAPNAPRSQNLQLLGDFGDRGFRVTEEHRGLRVEVQLVVDARESGAHRTLEHDDRPRLVHVEDRHAVDRGCRIRARRRVRHVVGADDQRHVGAAEFAVDLVHLLELLVWHVGLGEQHVHVARHASRDGVNGVPDLNPAVLEQTGHLPYRVLG